MKSGILIILLMVLLLVFVVCQDTSAAEVNAGQGGDTAFAWYSLIKPLGIATLSALGLTFLAGLFRRKLGRRFMKIHLALALTTVVLGLLHGLLVLILFGL